MAGKKASTYSRLKKAEHGRITKEWHGRTPIALVYPNVYHVGMSNLGFQTVYGLLNGYDHIVCERAFLPSQADAMDAIITIESGRPLTDFDIVAFSLSFENDYPNLLTILALSGVPLRSSQRGDAYPLIMAGGVACFLNPEPIAPFIDCFLIGEAESLLPGLAERLEEHRPNSARLEELARHVPGSYVPEFYLPAYHGDGTLAGFRPRDGLPDRVERAISKELAHPPACSTIITPETTFEETLLIEVGRGCPHGCRFCSAGFIYRPPRFHPAAAIQACMDTTAHKVSRVGLVGAAVSDFPGISNLCQQIGSGDMRISFSSLRADALEPQLLATLRNSRVKTATIAPDAGSERMRTVINKGLTENDILTAAETLVSAGIPNLKLYFMVGLPTESLADVDAIVTLVKKVKHSFLKSSRTRGKIGEITVSVSSFVPKPATPFQWVAMDSVVVLKQKIKRIKAGLKRVANVRIHADLPKWAYIQALLSRGDRRVADILELVHHNQGNWAKSLKETPLNSEFYVLRERSEGERLPWDFIDFGVTKRFLWREYQRALDHKVTPDCDTERCKACGVC